MSDEQQRCPRRDEMGQRGGPADELPDRWSVRGRDDGALGDKTRTCNYCGSMNPDDLMAMLEAGTCVIGPTDKNYKAYVNEPPASTEDAMGGPSIAKFYYQHLSESQRRRYFELHRDGKITYGYPGYAYTLPFFITRLTA